jgi:hypothetical protein
VLRKRVLASAARAAVAGVLILVVLAMSTGTTLAAGLRNESVKGVQFAASCLSRTLCVLAGYTPGGVGDIVVVHNGVPGHVSTVATLQGVVSVSCPSASGCVAIGNQAGVGVRFVEVNASGVVTSSRLVTVPAGVVLSRVACTKLTACAVAGTDIFLSPTAIEVGSWNGSILKLHAVSPPKGTTDVAVEGLSCWGAACDLVGYLEKGVTVTGYVVTATDGKPGHLQSVPGDSLEGVSCMSASRCYAAGYTQAGGLIVTLNSGKASSPQHVKPDLFAIACAGSSCTAVGEELPPSPSADAFWGAIVTVSSGKATSTQAISESGGYNGVGRIGSDFTAVGSAQKIGSEVTTG